MHNHGYRESVDACHPPRRLTTDLFTRRRVGLKKETQRAYCLSIVLTFDDLVLLNIPNYAEIPSFKGNGRGESSPFWN